MASKNGSYQLSQWNLTGLFPAHDSAEMKAAFENVESQVKIFEAKRPQLAADMDQAGFMDMVSISHLS